MVTKSEVKLVVVLIILLVASVWSVKANAGSEVETVTSIAKANGFKPSKSVIKAIVTASKAWSIDVSELTAIAIVETGLGKYAVKRLNRNGSYDVGLFQINSINAETCREYNLESEAGSALCAAKLLHNIKKRHADYLGRYHSKTPSLKAKYLSKVNSVMGSAE